MPETPTPYTNMWYQADSGSVIYMRPVLGGGEGFSVKLKTDQLPAGSDYLRESYHSGILGAMEQIEALMDRVTPNDWTYIPRTQVAEPGQ